MQVYEYPHIVSFEETNVVGNVYYVNFLRWQGRCREMFLHDLAPELLEQLTQGLAMVTTRVSCEFLAELSAFDEILIKMSLESLTQNRITMHFEYWRLNGDKQAEELVARGEQQVACMQRNGEQLYPTPIPIALRQALQAYGTG